MGRRWNSDRHRAGRGKRVRRPGSVAPVEAEGQVRTPAKPWGLSVHAQGCSPSSRLRRLHLAEMDFC